MDIHHKQHVSRFIEEVWNKRQLHKAEEYLHPQFRDHSLPPALPATAEGLKLWITETGKAFEHHTLIDEAVCEGDKVMLKIRMLLKHIGLWRGREPQGAEISAVGYRYFKLVDGKIAEHWALIDGNSIENQLQQCAHGCKIQE